MTDEFFKWQELWDAELSAQGPVNKEATPGGFFGVIDSESKNITPDENQAWQAIYGTPVPGFDKEYLLLKEDDGAKLKTNVDKLVKSPNPVKPETIGSDVVTTSVDNTYTPEDLDKLSELKLQLHKLVDNLNSVDGLGQKNKKLEGQISSLQEKIDELSTSLGQVLPQHVANDKSAI